MSGFDHLCFDGQEVDEVIPEIGNLQVENLRIYSDSGDNVCILFDLAGKMEIIESIDEPDTIKLSPDEFVELYPNTGRTIWIQNDKMPTNIIKPSMKIVHLMTERIILRHHEQYRSNVIKYLDEKVLPPMIVMWTRKYYE